MRTGFQFRGFTLIETLVVIGIIVVLAAILFPVFGAIREKGRQATCLSNQRQIALELLSSLQDHQDMLPANNMVWNSVSLPAPLLVCPDSPNLANGYVVNGTLLGKSLVNLSHPSHTLLTADGKSPNNIATDTNDLDERHDGRLIASFADGHVALCHAGGWLAEVTTPTSTCLAQTPPHRVAVHALPLQSHVNAVSQPPTPAPMHISKLPGAVSSKGMQRFPVSMLPRHTRPQNPHYTTLVPLPGATPAFLSGQSDVNNHAPTQQTVAIAQTAPNQRLVVKADGTVWTANPGTQVQVPVQWHTDSDHR